MSLNYDTLYGGDNDDTLTTGAVPKGDSYVYYATVHGGGGSDTITAQEDYESEHYGLYGDAGDDRIRDYSYLSRDLLSGGDGDDTIFVEGHRQKVDGGDGYDKIVSEYLQLSPSKVENVEELVLDTWAYVGDFDLHSFQKISIAADAQDPALLFSHAIDLNDLNIDTDGHDLRLDGSGESDRFDVSRYASHFLIFGGGGDDTILAGAESIRADGGDGNDYIQGGDGNDELSGGDEQDKNGYDTVLGLGGDDEITFNTGGGQFDGGQGEDTFYISGLPGNPPISVDNVKLESVEIIEFSSVSVVKLGAMDLSDVKKLVGNVEIFIAKGDVFDRAAVTEHSVIAIQGTEADDVSSFANSAGDLTFHGAGGDDTLSSDGGAAWLLGESGNDILSCRTGWNHLDGGVGNDVIHGGDGRDHIASGEGADKIDGGGGRDVIRLSISAADDVKIVNAGADGDEINALHGVVILGHGVIDGGDGDDVLRASGDLSGYSVRNVETLLLGGKLIASANVLNGFSTIVARQELLPADEKFELRLSHGGTFTWHNGSPAEYGSLTGSDGKDILDFSAAGNEWLIDGGGGRDQIVGTAFFDSISGGDDADVISSGAGNDQDFGGTGNDRIDAGEGDDFIDGGDGNDILIATSGYDALKGGSGQDKFVFSDDTKRATIYDFQASGADHDSIDLSQSHKVTNFDQLMQHAKSYPEGPEVVITFGGTEIILEGVNISDLQQANFIF